MLDRLKRLREEYEAAQDEAEDKREEYHTAIRKLYMSGVSLREIADALGITHQRVHKIVGVEPAQRKRKRRGGLLAMSMALFLLAGVFALSAGATAWASVEEYTTFSLEGSPWS